MRELFQRGTISAEGKESAAEVMLHILKERSRQEVLGSFLDFLFCFSSDFILIFEENTIIRVSSSLCTRLGFREDEIVGKSWTDFVIPEDMNRTEEVQKRFLGELTIRGFVNRWMTQSGTPVTFSWTAMRVKTVVMALVVEPS